MFVIVVVVVLFGVTVLVIVVVVVLFGVTVLVIVVVVVLFGVTVFVVFFVVVLFGVAMMVFDTIEEFVGSGHGRGQLDDLSTILQICLSQPQRRLIQVHSVHKYQVGLRQFHCVGGPRLEGMWVDARRHDGVEVDPIAADVVDDICKRKN